MKQHKPWCTATADISGSHPKMTLSPDFLWHFWHFQTPIPLSLFDNISCWQVPAIQVSSPTLFTSSKPQSKRRCYTRNTSFVRQPIVFWRLCNTDVARQLIAFKVQLNTLYRSRTIQEGKFRRRILQHLCTMFDAKNCTLSPATTNTDAGVAGAGVSTYPFNLSWA